MIGGHREGGGARSATLGRVHGTVVQQHHRTTGRGEVIQHRLIPARTQSHVDAPGVTGIGFAGQQALPFKNGYLAQRRRRWDGGADTRAGDGNPSPFLGGDEQIQKDVPSRFPEQFFGLEDLVAAASVFVSLPSEFNPHWMILARSANVWYRRRGARWGCLILRRRLELSGHGQQFIGNADQAHRLCPASHDLLWYSHVPLCPCGGRMTEVPVSARMIDTR